jgi:hypothetical protein
MICMDGRRQSVAIFSEGRPSSFPDLIRATILMEWQVNPVYRGP